MDEFQLFIEYKYSCLENFLHLIVTSKTLNLSHISKCREVLYSNPSIIGFPNPNFSEKDFTLIYQTSMFADRIIDKLEKNEFQVLKKTSVTRKQFMAAIMYTIELRMSPLWNRVGPVFIEGRDFLSRHGYQCCMDMSVSLKDKDDLVIGVLPRRINIKRVRLEDLAIDAALVKEFTESTSYVISAVSIPLRTVHVIPSLKPAQIISIHKGAIPAQTPFLTHLDLQKHWKNQYGYRLPDLKNNVYAEISFLSKYSTKFLYPMDCLLASQPEYTSEPEPNIVVDLFTQQFKYHFPSLCGIALSVKYVAHGQSRIDIGLTMTQKLIKEPFPKPKSILKSFSVNNTQQSVLDLELDDTLFNVVNHFKSPQCPARLVSGTRKRKQMKKIDSLKNVDISSAGSSEFLPIDDSEQDIPLLITRVVKRSKVEDEIVVIDEEPTIEVKDVQRINDEESDKILNQENLESIVLESMRDKDNHLSQGKEGSIIYVIQNGSINSYETKDVEEEPRYNTRDRCSIDDNNHTVIDDIETDALSKKNGIHMNNRQQTRIADAIERVVDTEDRVVWKEDEGYSTNVGDGIITNDEKEFRINGDGENLIINDSKVLLNIKNQINVEITRGHGEGILPHLVPNVNMNYLFDHSELEKDYKGENVNNINKNEFNKEMPLRQEFGTVKQSSLKNTKLRLGLTRSRIAKTETMKYEE